MGKETKWQIIFEGNLFEGQKKSPVKKRMAELFKMDQPAVDNLFKGGPVIFKSDLLYPQALKYQAAFQKTGAKCRIVATENPAQAANQSGRYAAPFAEKAKAEKSAAAPLNSRITEAFQIEMNHFPFPWTYKISLVFVNLGLTLLLLLYLFLVVLFGYAGYSLAITNLKTAFTSWTGKVIGSIIFLITLLIVTAILFFLVKPLLPHRFKKNQTLELNPFKEQTLFSFIQHLCEIMRAPMPRRIEVDCRAGLSLRFSEGLAGFLGGELNLILGLPLPAGLSLNQWTALISHELRHFSEGTHMRLTYMARRINHLFKEGSSSGDSIDAIFVQWSQREELYLQMPAQIALFLALLSRKLMGLWLQGCRLISGYLLQQLEYDADRHEIQLTGNAHFADTLLRLNGLKRVTQQTMQNLAQDWKERHLVDDLMSLVMSNLEHLPPATAEQLKRNLSQEETTLFQTQPSDKTRIALVAANPQAGLLNLDMPAKDIFADFPNLSRQMTLHYYRSQMNLPVAEKNLLPVTAVLKHQTRLETSQNSFKKYMAGLFINLRPLPLQARPDLHNQPVKERIGTLLKRAAQIKKLLIKDKKSLKEFQDLDEKVLALIQADALLQADLIIESESFNLADGTPDVAKRALKKTLTDKANLESQVGKLTGLIATRLELAFSLLEEPPILKHIPNAAESQREAALLLKIYPEFAVCFPLLDRLRSASVALAALNDNLKNNKDNPAFLTVFNQKQTECRSHLIALYDCLKKIDYPAETGETRVSVAEFIMENDPEKIDAKALLAGAQAMIDNMLNLHTQWAGRMAVLAETVEKVIDRIVQRQTSKNHA